jgi:hypothetical protein
MKIFRSAFLALGTSVIGTTLLTMPASAIDFGFSFENALNGAGSVTGVIRGLEEGTGAATSVEVLSNTAGFGLGEYVGSPSNNSWTVLSGNLVAFNFLSFGVNNTPPAATNATLFFNSSEVIGASFRAGISTSPYSVTTGSSGVTTEDINLTFNRLDESESVPEPTSILSLLAVSAAAMGTTLKRKQA